MKEEFKKSCGLLSISDELPEVSKISEKHAKAIQSMYKLIIIAEAWNKKDEFVPDYNDYSQQKWYPYFYKISPSAFAFDASFCAYTDADAGSGSRLCFKSKKRADQFGKENIDLWNDFLLFNN